MTPHIETIDFNGIEALRLWAASGASAVVSRFGGQVLSWTTPDGRERLFLSERARYDGSVAIRGGIPVCFPQFAEFGSLPKHGLLRTRTWTTGEQSAADDYVMATLAIGDDEATRALWPHAFRAELTVMLEAHRLDVELSIENTGDAPFEFTAALHSYLRVTQVEDAALGGLHGCEYRDAAAGGRTGRESGPEIVFERATDRIYHDVRRPLLLQAGNLSAGVNADGFPDVVVWNPWDSGSAAIADLDPGDFRHFLCVEAAAVATPIRLEAGGNWYGRQTLVAV